MRASPQARSATADADWGAFADDYVVDPRARSPRRARLRRLQRQDRASPAASSLPHGPRDERTFATADGRAPLHGQRARATRSLPPARLLLQTLRSHDQYNTTIYGLDDRYRGIQRRPPRRVRQPGRPRDARASRRRRRRSALDRRRRGATASRRGFRRRGLPDAAWAPARPTTPRRTCSCRCTASAKPAPRRSSRSPSSCSDRADRSCRPGRPAQVRVWRRRARLGDRRRAGCGT